MFLFERIRKLWSLEHGFGLYQHRFWREPIKLAGRDRGPV